MAESSIIACHGGICELGKGGRIRRPGILPWTARADVQRDVHPAVDDVQGAGHVQMTLQANQDDVAHPRDVSLGITDEDDHCLPAKAATRVALKEPWGRRVGMVASAIPMVVCIEPIQRVPDVMQDKAREAMREATEGPLRATSMPPTDELMHPTKCPPAADRDRHQVATARTEEASFMKDFMQGPPEVIETTIAGLLKQTSRDGSFAIAAKEPSIHPVALNGRRPGQGHHSTWSVREPRERHVILISRKREAGDSLKGVRNSTQVPHPILQQRHNVVRRAICHPPHNAPGIVKIQLKDVGCESPRDVDP